MNTGALEAIIEQESRIKKYELKLKNLDTISTLTNKEYYVKRRQIELDIEVLKIGIEGIKYAQQLE
jgi:hypothetical protein